MVSIKRTYIKSLGFVLCTVALGQTNDIPGPLGVLPLSDHSAPTSLFVWDKTNVYKSGFTAGVMTVDVIYKLPIADAAGCMVSDGSKVLSIDPTCSGSFPIPDNITIFKNNSDNTKTVKLDLSNITTSTNRTLSIQDNNYILAGVNINNSFSATQNTQSLIPNVNVTYSLGGTSNRWLKLWVQDIDCSGTCLGSPPFTDNLSIVKNLADNTKQISFDASAITTGRTRRLTVKDASYIIAGTNISNDFIGDQNFSGALIPDAPNGYNIGTLANPWLELFVNRILCTLCPQPPFDDTNTLLFQHGNVTKTVTISSSVLQGNSTNRTYHFAGNNDYTITGDEISNTFLNPQSIRSVANGYGLNGVLSIEDTIGTTGVGLAVLSNYAGAITAYSTQLNNNGNLVTITGFSSFAPLFVTNQNTTGSTIEVHSNEFGTPINTSPAILSRGWINPYGSGGYGLGTSSAPWGSVYSNSFNGPIITPVGGTGSTIQIGASGNFFTRPIASESALNCSGVPDAFFAVANNSGALTLLSCYSNVRYHSAVMTPY